MLESVLVTIATAATPLLIAAIGELVVERSGVLNLGVEGMMVMGAYGHSKIRQFLVGSTTTAMIEASKTPLLILR